VLGKVLSIVLSTVFSIVLGIVLGIVFSMRVTVGPSGPFRSVCSNYAEQLHRAARPVTDD
jgi:hypothetical protein